MKDNKKIYTIAIVLVFLAITAKFFWPTPIKTDMKNLCENEVILQANYEAMIAEVDSWNTSLQGGPNLQYNVNMLLGDFQYGVNNVIVPKIDNSIAILELTELSTPEVIAIKDQYIESLELFKEGSEKMLVALKNNDDDIYNQAKSLLTQAEQGFNSCQTDFEALAKKNCFMYFK